MGNKIADKIEAKDTILVSTKIKSQLRISKIRIIFNPGILIARAIKTPKLVAIPLPPLNFKNMVQLCPAIQLKPIMMRSASCGR